VRALELAPDQLEWWRNLGRLCLDVGDVEQLERAARRLLAADPEHAEAKVQLANALYRKDEYQGACQLLETVPRLGTSGANALNLLGILSARQARIDEGLPLIAKACDLAPDAAELHNNFLLHSNYDPELSPSEVTTRHLAWAARFADPLTPERVDFGLDRNPDRQVGYLSPDFRRHSVSHFIAPLLAAHDPESVDVVCYASVARPDAVTESLKRLAPTWHDVRHLDDAGLAARIRADRIDILVDLAGHTLDGRLLACARRPAPIQITHIGYPNTTGMRAFDYRITDHVADPDGFDAHYRETLIRLPGCFLCYAPPEHAPDVAPPPCLEHAFITFGSFNNLAKLNRGMGRGPTLGRGFAPAAQSHRHRRSRYRGAPSLRLRGARGRARAPRDRAARAGGA
jgi:protein O-GlcNAc transferase